MSDMGNGRVVERLRNWIHAIGQPAGNGRANPDNDMIYLLRDAADEIEELRARAEAAEAKLAQTHAALAKAREEMLKDLLNRWVQKDESLDAAFDAAEDEHCEGDSGNANDIVEAALRALVNQEWKNSKFALGDRVTKSKGSSWTGRIVGFYSTTLTPKGYAVESENEPGSVQIYPEAALIETEIMSDEMPTKSKETDQ